MRLSGQLPARCATTEAEVCQDISGATAEVYDLTSDDVRSRVRVQGTTDSGKASSYSPETPAITASVGSASEKLVFANGPGLYIAAGSGAEPQQVATCTFVNAGFSEEDCSFFHPQISPNGQQIVAEVSPNDDPATCPADSICPDADTAPDSQIVVMNYDGTEAHALAENASQPSWTADGSGLLVTQTIEGLSGTKTQLTRVNVNGSDPTPLAPELEDSESASYSSDGTMIAFVGKSSPFGSWSLYLDETENEAPVKITLEGVRNVDSPQISPDGSKVVFSAVDAATPPSGIQTRSLYEVNTDGTELSKVSTTGGDYSSPAFAGGGDNIVSTHRTITHSAEGGWPTIRTAEWRTSLESHSGEAITPETSYEAGDGDVS